MSGPQGDHLFGKPGNVREFDTSVGEKIFSGKLFIVNILELHQCSVAY